MCIRDRLDLTEEMGLTNEMLFLLVKQKCQEKGIAQSLVLQKNEIAKTQLGDTKVEFLYNWRRDFLGGDFIDLLKKPGKMKMKLSGRKVSVRFGEQFLIDNESPGA